MCGIAGMVRFSGLRPHEADVGLRMAETLRHRGPDDVGLFHDAAASLGHTRLSIMDVAAGHQPMSNEDGTVQVVFNGEIYNHPALFGMLRRRGHVLHTRCDTEVIAHLYEDYGEDFVTHLNGMFAIALWDTRRRRLLLVRDRVGVKPLYWHDDGTRVTFGSELKALLIPGDVERGVDPCALSDFLTFGHVPAPRTIFRDMRKLEPGCMAICTAAGTRVRRYWDITFAESPPASEGDWIDEYAALITDAVSLRLVADVPVGAFLSGGVDSTTVAAAMCRAGRGAVLTHTVGFDEADHDERGAAREAAELLKTDHHEVLIRPDAAWAAEHLARHFDEPFADSSAIPTWYLSAATRERVTVALSGDGPDEVLGGYRRYRFDLAEQRFRSACPLWLRVPAAGLAGMLYPKADWLPRPLRAKRTLENLSCDAATAHLRSVALRGGALPHLLLHAEVRDQLGGHDPFLRGRELHARCPSRDPLNRLLYVDMKTLMADDILTKVDRASMAVGLEAREPLLDYRLVELAGRTPREMKLGKRVLRGVLTRWTNSQFAARGKKGFNVPVDAWFRGPLRAMAHDLLAAPSAMVNAWLAPRAVRGILKDHESGRRSDGHVLWAMLSLELWARAYLDNSAAQVARSGRPLPSAAVHEA